MAIFARKSDPKVEAISDSVPVEIDEDAFKDNEDAVNSVAAQDARPDTSSQNSEQQSEQQDVSGVDGPGSMAASENGPGGTSASEAQIVEPVLANVAATMSVVESGVVEPAVIEPVDIEPELIEPETIEPPIEANGSPAFGIADAIRLMRSLPSDPNIDLVVRVVRVTLGAVNVSIEDIEQDAARKEKTIQDIIAALQVQADALEKQLYAKRCEIVAHQADLNETVTVREQLHLADKHAGHRPPPTPADATRNPHPKPSEWAEEWAKSEQSNGEHIKGFGLLPG